jgi:hypothetical protein
LEDAMNQLSSWYRPHSAQSPDPTLQVTLAIAIRDLVDERLAPGSFTRIAQRHDSGWSDAWAERDWVGARPVLAALELALRYGESIEEVIEDLVARCLPQLLLDGDAEPDTQPTALLGHSERVLHRVLGFASVETDLNVLGLYEAWIHGIPHDLDPLVRGLWQGLAPALEASGAVKQARCTVVQCEQGVLGKRMFVRCRYR